MPSMRARNTRMRVHARNTQVLYYYRGLVKTHIGNWLSAQANTNFSVLFFIEFSSTWGTGSAQANTNFFVLFLSTLAPHRKLAQRAGQYYALVFLINYSTTSETSAARRPAFFFFFRFLVSL